MYRIKILVALPVFLLTVVAGCVGELPSQERQPLEKAPATLPPTTAPSSDERPPLVRMAITSISPEFGHIDGGTIVQIWGENITPGAIVYFIQGGRSLEATNTFVMSDSAIAARTPRSSRAGFADVRVVLPDGQTDTLQDGFRYRTGFEGPTMTTPPQQVVPVSSEKLQVHFIDVGQGDAILVDLEETEILIDGGSRSPGVASYINQYVDGTLEVMVATHPHVDHIGGLIEVLDKFEVKQLWHNGDKSDSATYKNFMAAVQSENAEIHLARLHDVITADGLSFYVHNPSRIFNNTNNNSIVLHLTHGNTDFLFTGDVEMEAEGAMMALSSVPVPDVEILKVGHHGSKTSSSKNFVAITRPEVAVYMAGEGNNYGHPHEETIETLNTAGAMIYGTDTHGNIVVTTDGETYTLQVENPVGPLLVNAPRPPPKPSVATIVRITKVFYEGVVSKVESDEYVEITNFDNESHDLAGWVLMNITEGYPSFTFPSYVLAPGSSIRVYTNELHNEWGSFSFGSEEAVWNNSNPNTAALYDAEGNEVSRKSY